jgi:NAD+ synthase
MNIENSQLDSQCLNDLKKQNRFPIIEYDLLPIFNQYKKILKIKNKLALANLKARIRMNVLYNIALENNLIVAGTGNADELYMGYFTKYGDGGCDILPIAYLNKSQIFTAANLLNLPLSIIKREPTASLYDGQTDEKEIGVTYNEIDKFLLGKTINMKALKIIKNLHKKNLHKLNLPVKPGNKFYEQTNH